MNGWIRGDEGMEKAPPNRDHKIQGRIVVENPVKKSGYKFESIRIRFFHRKPVFINHVFKPVFFDILII